MPSETVTPRMDKADRTATLFILILGSFAGGVTAASGLLNAVFRILDPAGRPVHVLADIPIEATSGVQVTAQELSVVTQHLPSTARWLYASSDLIFGLMVALITLSLAYALYRVVKGDPFHQGMHTATLVAGGSLAVGGLLHQGLYGFATINAASALADSIHGEVGIGFPFDPMLPIIGLVVVALAYVFRIGERLQRDTEGLI